MSDEKPTAYGLCELAERAIRRALQKTKLHQIEINMAVAEIVHDLSATAASRDIEALAEAVHNAYLETCKRLGWEVKPSNQVPYTQLSEDSKELDRASVRAVLAHFSPPANALSDPDDVPDLLRDEDPYEGLTVAGLMEELQKVGIEYDLERWFTSAEPGPVESDSLSEAIRAYMQLVENHLQRDGALSSGSNQHAWITALTVAINDLRLAEPPIPGTLTTLRELRDALQRDGYFEAPASDDSKAQQLAYTVMNIREQIDNRGFHYTEASYFYRDLNKAVELAKEIVRPHDEQAGGGR